jgi:hypothetical protein
MFAGLWLDNDMTNTAATLIRSALRPVADAELAEMFWTLSTDPAEGDAARTITLMAMEQEITSRPQLAGKWAEMNAKLDEMEG